MIYSPSCTFPCYIEALLALHVSLSWIKMTCRMVGVKVQGTVSFCNVPRWVRTGTNKRLQILVLGFKKNNCQESPSLCVAETILHIQDRWPCLRMLILMKHWIRRTFRRTAALSSAVIAYVECNTAWWYFFLCVFFRRRAPRKDHCAEKQKGSTLAVCHAWPRRQETNV